MKGARQGIRSTKLKPRANVADDGTKIKIEGEADPPSATPHTKENDVYFITLDMAEEIHSNNTGPFPYILQWGKKIVTIAVHVNANYIFAETIRNKSEGKQIRSYQKLIDRMRRAKLGLHKHVLDNEISKEFKKRIEENNMIHESVLPSNHRMLIEERAIQTWKSHMILIMNGVDENFPISSWCQLVSQAKLTFNLLRQSNIVPAISAFTHVHGQHDYMRHPFTPIGCRVEIHVKPGDRGTWDMRCELGFSVGTSMEHYPCYKVYVSQTRSIRVSDQVHFQQKYITNPSLSPESHVVAAAQQLTIALRGNIPAGNKTAEGLTLLSEIFNKIAVTKAEVAALCSKQAIERRTIRLYPDSKKVAIAPSTVATTQRVIQDKDIADPRVLK